MATISKHVVKAPKRGLYVIPLSFETKAGSNPDAADNKGVGFTVVRSAAATYTVTLDEPAIDIVSVVGTLQLNAGAARYLQIGAISVANKTIVVRAEPTGSGDIAENANNRVNLFVAVQYLS